VNSRFDELLQLWHTGLVMCPELLEEMIELEPPDAQFLALPSATQFGVGNVEQFLANTHDIQGRHKRAMDQGCFIEVIAIRVQHIELWLRMYWVVKNPDGGALSADDRRTFGMIINDCAQLGLPDDLERDLRLFNDVRINAVHKYVLGDIGYGQLETAASDHADLDSRTVDFVEAAIARPATVADLQRGRGSMIIAPVPRSGHA
jgi:hypothetical protein